MGISGDAGQVRAAADGEQFVSFVRYRRTPVLVAYDASVLFAAYAFVLVIRYGFGPETTARLDWVMLLAGIAVLVHTLFGQFFRFHQGRVAVGSVEETVLLALTAVVGTSAVFWVNGMDSFADVARLIPLTASFVALCFMIFTRALWRLITNGVESVYPETGQRALIIGAGEAGHQLVSSMRGVDSPYMPVALLDDDRWLQHRRVLGVPVRGRSSDLVSICSREHIQVIIVAVPSAGGEWLRRIQALAASVHVPVKVLPSVAEILDRRVTIRDVRDIDVADILGRKQIDTDIESIAHFLAGKRVLVTGAGGSIGSELCRQIARWDPSALFMLDRDESALHSVQLSIHGHGLLDTDDMVLCDIRDAGALREVFDHLRPEVVFHAAALKHLPMLERYPAEAIKTNVVGTINVLEAARAVGVERFVNISTDKAADPTSVLGLSKRVAERVTADVARRADGTYISVRFGNVLGSRGSVLTAWTAQIAQGGPITVTHPDVTRYFMTIAEACQLVLQAGATGRDGEVLILDMGEPVRLDDVARQLIEQSGRDIKIVYTGLRQGEKMEEVLIADAESDARPFHELISHVPVVPLDEMVVGTAALATDGFAARSALEMWTRNDGVSPSATRVADAAKRDLPRSLWMIGDGHDAPAPV